MERQVFREVYLPLFYSSPTNTVYPARVTLALVLYVVTCTADICALRLYKEGLYCIYRYTPTLKGQGHV
jgi:hypothetical protein